MSAPLIIALWFGFVVSMMVILRTIFARRGSPTVEWHRLIARYVVDFIVYVLPLTIMLSNR